MAEEVVLEKPDAEKKLDESLSGFEGKEGSAPEDEELAALPEELAGDDSEGFNFSREAAPEAPEAAPAKESTFEEEEAPPKKEEAWYQDRKFMGLVGLSSGIVLALVFTLFYLTFSEDKIKPDFFATKNEPRPIVPIDESYDYKDMTKIDGMIQKANALYLKGEVEQALEIYAQVAIYNEALSNYNLGVSQMGEGKFNEALGSFKKAIENGENQSVSAINAAVCALRLGDEEKFRYYVDLAEIYLPKEGRSRLYDYYLSLINYYKGYYPEALQMLQKTNVEPYTDSAKYLAAKIYTKMNYNQKAIDALKAQESFESSLSLGLLYARVGAYERARGALETAMKIERDFNQSLAAITLVDLKMGKFEDMLARLNGAYKDEAQKYKILKTYKIKTRLNKELFNINIAQKNFSKDLLLEPKNQFDLLFYFAPYQVFDSRQAALYIKKANIAGFVEDALDAGNYLSSGRAISSTNVKIAHIINLALNQHLRQANAEFKTLLENYPEHSILHYNLALTYAQLQNYDLAYKHFASAYHLNPKNYQAGAFAMLSANLSGINTDKFYNEIMENISLDTEFKANMQKNMLFLSHSDFVSMLPFLDEEKQDSPLSLIFEAIIAKNNGLEGQVGLKLAKLKALTPSDIVSNILHFNASNKDIGIKEYAQNAQIYFKNLNFDYKNIFGGSDIAREYYVSLMHVAGLLNLERKKFKELLSTTTKNNEGLVQVLAYLDIFAGQFQEAYALYNILIDEYKIRDSHTLFLAAVAATGANNPNSAIALLQLAKLSDKNNKESKAALGFLYHEVQNYEPALLQYKGLPNDFKSKFFTFDLQT